MPTADPIGLPGRGQVGHHGVAGQDTPIVLVPPKERLAAEFAVSLDDDPDVRREQRHRSGEHRLLISQVSGASVVEHTPNQRDRAAAQALQCRLDDWSVDARVREFGVVQPPSEALDLRAWAATGSGPDGDLFRRGTATRRFVSRRATHNGTLA